MRRRWSCRKTLKNSCFKNHEVAVERNKKNEKKKETKIKWNTREQMILCVRLPFVARRINKCKSNFTLRSIRQAYNNGGHRETITHPICLSLFFLNWMLFFFAFFCLSIRSCLIFLFHWRSGAAFSRFQTQCKRRNNIKNYNWSECVSGIFMCNTLFVINIFFCLNIYH